MISSSTIQAAAAAAGGVLTQEGFGNKIGRLDENGAWQLVERTAPLHSYPYSETHARLQHWVCIYRNSA